jgi:L-ascorbate metabolism protein UlaG (beta-lactamase superfamily)
MAPGAILVLCMASSADAVTWLGHSLVVVDLGGRRIATDPVLRRRVAHLRQPREVEVAELGQLDAVLISHVHYDHLDVRSLARLDRSVPLVVPRGAASIVRRHAFEDLREVVPGDVVDLGGMRVEVTDAAHGSVRRIGGRVLPALGFVLRGEHSVYFAGDTDLFDGMAALRPVDVALLPVAGWGSKVGPGHLDPRRAAEALRLLRPRIAIPVHFGTFRTVFAPAPDDSPAVAFARAAAEVAPDVDVRVLRPGETLALERRGS